MMGLSLSHLLLVIAVILIIFGAGKLPKMMGDVAKGIRAFREGIKASDPEDIPEKLSAKKKDGDDKQC